MGWKRVWQRERSSGQLFAVACPGLPPCIWQRLCWLGAVPHPPEVQPGVAVLGKRGHARLFRCFGALWR